MGCFPLILIEQKLPQGCPKWGGVKATFWQCLKVSGYFSPDYFPYWVYGNLLRNRPRTWGAEAELPENLGNIWQNWEAHWNSHHEIDRYETCIMCLNNFNNREELIGVGHINTSPWTDFELPLHRHICHYCKLTLETNDKIEEHIWLRTIGNILHEKSNFSY